MLRYLIPSLCVVLLAGNVFAGGQAKPNTLTEQEIRDGWILLFDGETTFGWKVRGEAKVKAGTLILGDGGPTKATTTTKFRYLKVQIDGWWTGQSRPELKIGRFQTAFPTDKVKANQAFSFSYLIDERQVPVSGSHALTIQVPAKSALVIKNIKLKPLATKSLFNGKNLDGWKVLPGYKSKFTVTKEGWLNVKDGRGDIQTTDTFKDFVLQVECISNGKHLNSGIFFRCIPGQYQNGYEAQIRNEFTPGQKRPYKLDKYDPKTNKKIGTYVVESEAIDFGTGAIYRRMPARKQMSKDGEWFTMTVVANGRHFATWVNGVQVVDWTDHRPLHDNARQGCCLNAGAISIQGHDPTTDLSFRNFRIAEFPSAKNK